MITDRNGQQEIFLKLIIKYNFARKEEYLSNNNLASEFVEKGVLFKPIKTLVLITITISSILGIYMQWELLISDCYLSLPFPIQS